MTEPDTNLFARYIPGFEFLQNLTRQTAGSAAPGAASSVPGMPPLSHWVAPTFDVEELDKRIQDLKAVHFWLDQNTKALAATIQALEVQKMTLATLKSMNVSMQDMADAFKMSPTSSPASSPPAAPEPAPAPAPAPAPEAAPETGPSAPPVVDPMQWWSALTQQFQTIATGAMQDMAQHVQASAEAVAAAQATAQTPVAKPGRAKPRRPAAPKASRPAAHQSGHKASPSVTAKATKAAKTVKTPPSAAPSAKSGATKSTNAPARAKPATRSR